MDTDQAAPPGPHQAIAGHADASTPPGPPTSTAHGGWTLQRPGVINRRGKSPCPLRDAGRWHRGSRLGRTSDVLLVRSAATWMRSSNPINPGPSSTSASVHSSWRGTTRPDLDNEQHRGGPHGHLPTWTAASGVSTAAASGS